jgi:hypothetical protein
MFKVKALGATFVEEILSTVAVEGAVTAFHLSSVDRFKILTIGTDQGSLHMISALTGDKLFNCEFASDGPAILGTEFAARSITDPSTILPTGAPAAPEAVVEVFAR